MFNITLYKFTKKLNSTAIPLNVPSDTFSCTFLDRQSIMDPVIVIEDTKGNPSTMNSYTYAYISDLGRYYFISNCVILGTDRYCYYLQVDVLATFKIPIRNSTQYVLRSSNRYNEYIIDKMYPTLPITSSDRFSMTTKTGNYVYAMNNKTGAWRQKDFFNQAYTSGSVIFGVTGQGNVSISHYVATVNDFKTFINKVVTATPTGFNWGNLPTGVQASMSNLMQYITFAKWIPFLPETDNLGNNVTSIYLGTTEITNISAYEVTPGLNFEKFYFSLSIPDHPLISEHLYYNMAPYRQIGLFFFPLGIIPLDTTKFFASQQSVFVKFKTDLSSGDTLFTVDAYTDYTGDDEMNGVLYSSIGNIGINLSLTEYSMSMEAALLSAGSSFLGNALTQTFGVGGGSQTHISSSGATHGGHGGSFTPAETVSVSGRDTTNLSIWPNFGHSLKQDFINKTSPIGNALSGFGDILTTMGDFISSSFGQVVMNGKTDSFLQGICLPAVFCWFMKHGDEDYARFGRPFCEQTSLGLCTGFCVCRNAYLDTFTGTQPLKPELDSIINLMNTGFYME